jgi:hypothetical protein
MSDERWAAFREEVYYSTEIFAGPIVTSAEGTGVYEGTRETTYVVVGASDPWSAGAFRARISIMAAEYGQDAIAIAVASPEFVGAPEQAGVEQAG